MWSILIGGVIAATLVLTFSLSALPAILVTMFCVRACDYATRK